MNENWKLSKLSTPERILDKITSEIPQPVGIIIIGPDCRQRDETVDYLLEKQRQAVRSNMPFQHEEEHYRFGRQGSIISLMKSSEASYVIYRRELFERLRDAGMKCIVAVCIDSDEELEEAEEEAARKLLRVYPPSPDEVDYLVTVPS